jgi:hypothetical protein
MEVYILEGDRNGQTPNPLAFRLAFELHHGKR